MNDLLRVYLDPLEIGRDGYPYAWHGKIQPHRSGDMIGELADAFAAAQALGDHKSIKEYVREQAEYRCERCGHPYPPGITQTCPRGEWTPCDEECTHRGPARIAHPHGGHFDPFSLRDTDVLYEGTSGEMVALSEEPIEAQWRILTTHHLNGVKHDCRWWNLAALCQRCHLAIQGKVLMERIWPREHSEWFKPHAAGWYAYSYLGEELTREQTVKRLDELLALEQQTHQ